MLLILCHLIISYAFFWLTGHAVFAFISGLKPPKPLSVSLPITGFIVSIPLLSYLSLAFPLNINVFLILSILFLLIYLLKPLTLHSSPFTHHPSPFTLHPSPLTLHSSLIILLLLSAAIVPTLPDMWGYHVQSIQWTEKYPVVHGLGNLCSKFAFNFGSFLPSALLSFRAFNGQPLFTLNLFLFLLILLYYSFLYKRLESFAIKLLLLLSILAVFHYFKPLLSSTSLECTSALLIILLFLLYLSKNYDPDSSNNVAYTWIIVGLLLILPMIKLSNIIFLLLLLPLWIKKGLKPLWIALLALLLFWFPWLSRNVILSSYLWYPFPFVDVFHYSWKIPKDIAIQDFHWIRSWARTPYQSSEIVLNQDFSQWIIDWVKHSGLFFWFFFITGIIGSTYVIIRHKIRGNIAADIQYFWIVLLINLVFWFFMAPDPRFIISTLVLFAAIPLMFILPSYSFSSLYNIIIPVFLIFFTGFEIITTSSSACCGFIKPNAFPTTEMKTVDVGWLKVNVPLTGVNSYDYPLPSAPSVREGLQVRGKTLQDGFIQLRLNNPHNIETLP